MSFSSAGSSDADPADSISFAWDFDGNGTTDSIDAAPTSPTPPTASTPPG